MQVKCVCSHFHNDHAPEVATSEPCLVCPCQEYRPERESYGAQYVRLAGEPCPFYSESPEGRTTRPRHLLIKVATHSWRDLFRPRRFWRCYRCDLREEMRP